jgi:hypothetical protein
LQALRYGARSDDVSALIGASSADPSWELWKKLNELVAVSFKVSELRALAAARAASVAHGRRKAGLRPARSVDEANQRIRRSLEESSKSHYLVELAGSLFAGGNLCHDAIGAIVAGGAKPVDDAVNPGARGWSVALSARLESAAWNLFSLSMWVRVPEGVPDDAIGDLERFGGECGKARAELSAAMKLRGSAGQQSIECADDFGWVRIEGKECPVVGLARRVVAELFSQAKRDDGGVSISRLGTKIGSEASRFRIDSCFRYNGGKMVYLALIERMDGNRVRLNTDVAKKWRAQSPPARQ